MSITFWLALVVIAVTVYVLIKRYETRLVLFTTGLVMCLITFDPMAALNQFAK